MSDTYLIAKAQAAIDAGDIPALARHCQKIIAKRPGSYASHYLLGVLLARIGALEGAEAALASARGVNPGAVQAGFDLAQVMRARGNVEGALREVCTLLARDAGVPELWALRRTLVELAVGGAPVPAGGRSRRPNVLYSTTRQWNPGDEFILFGCQSLVDEVLGPHNPQIFNRSYSIKYPDLFLKDNPCFNVPPGQAGCSFEQISAGQNLDNSFKSFSDLNGVDLVVFAGSPDWDGTHLAPLYRQLAITPVPVVYLGIGRADSGAVYGSLSAQARSALERAALITVRDDATASMLAHLGPLKLPCPALYSSPTVRRRRSLGTLGLVIQAPDLPGANPHAIPLDMFRHVVTVFRRLEEIHDCRIICHYGDEVDFALSAFRSPVLYSYDSRDYPRFYDEMDAMVSLRVHGSGLAASLGVPSLTLAHSSRTPTVTGFLSEAIAPDAPVALFEERLAAMAMDLSARSAALIAHKEKSRAEIVTVLRQALEGAG